jgi:peptidoglycan/LPS O-acetylase OafA/YrhL
VTHPIGNRVESDRNTRLDGCRILASLGILYLHTFIAADKPRQGDFGRFAVPFFTSSAMYLLLQSHRHRPDRPFTQYLKNRFVRLYVPFLAWGLLGLLLMNLKHHFISHQSWQPLRWDFLINGASIQLWFLPFIFLAGLVLFTICRGLVSLTRGWQILAVIVLLGIAVIVGVSTSIGINDPNSAWQRFVFRAGFGLQTSPSLFIGIAIALLTPGGKVPRWIGWAGLLAVTSLSTYIRFMGRDDLLENAAGAGLLLFALGGGPLLRSPLWRRYAFLAYGIYLSQNIVLEPVRTMLNCLHVIWTTPIILAMFAVNLLITASISILLNRSRHTRWLLG